MIGSATGSSSRLLIRAARRARPSWSSFATLAHQHDEDDCFTANATSNTNNNHNNTIKHCQTCSCSTTTAAKSADTFPCGTVPDDDSPLPPPLPEPRYSVRRRVLCTDTVTLFNSLDGRQYLLDALQQHTAASYLALTEHSCNQSDPAYCGITTLLMVLNALAMDPHVRWKGGWRYYGSETMLLSTCCLSQPRIERVGITMKQFAQLATCQGIRIETKQPSLSKEYTLQDFRKDVIKVLTEPSQLAQNIDRNTPLGLPNGILVVSFGRSALHQTGDGHFSPIAAYHQATDQVLVLDVARFKYQHYWVKLETLYAAMELHDEMTQQSRGWFICQAPSDRIGKSMLQQQEEEEDATTTTTTTSSSLNHTDIVNCNAAMSSEDRRDVKFAPLAGQGHPCPIHAVKVEFCAANKKE